MEDKRFSFDLMPQLLVSISERLDSIAAKVDHLTLHRHESEKDEWLNLKGLCNYLPSHPAQQTVYGWTSTHLIPFHKRGKNISFRRSEIDEWLAQGRKKSQQDLQREAEEFVNQKKNKGGVQ